MERKAVSMVGSTYCKVSAKSWVIWNAEKGGMMQGRMEKERREIASITKIMTAFTAIKLIKEFDINIAASKIEASFDASLMGGTSADLAEGDVLSVHDMLHAMLLPSGNDAACAIAEYFGLLLMDQRMSPTAHCWDPVQVFISEMNRNSKALGLSSTTFANPHGLQNVFNKSTAYDVAKLSAECMKSTLFAEIVRKSKYSCMGEDLFGYKKPFTWHSTNKMLAKGFIGLKTGVTPAAGPCLVSCYMHGSTLLILVLLGSKNYDSRWPETLLLRDMAIQELSNGKSCDHDQDRTPEKSRQGRRDVTIRPSRFNPKACSTAKSSTY